MTTLAMPVHVALVDSTGTIGAADLAEVAGALNQQVQSDFTPVWRVAATVGAYPAAPPHTWRIELRRELDKPGAAGYHADENHQPYSLVDVDDGQWTITASHELLEMLGDPWGNRLHAAKALTGWEGTSPRVQYLVELCDPCEMFSYQVGGVAVSDFLLPDFYRSSDRGTGRYSFLGSLTSALEVADGGYISFVDPADQHVWQRFTENGTHRDVDWGVQSLDGQMVRERCDHLAREYRASASSGDAGRRGEGPGVVGRLRASGHLDQLVDRCAAILDAGGDERDFPEPVEYLRRLGADVTDAHRLQVLSPMTTARPTYPCPDGGMADCHPERRGKRWVWVCECP